MSTLPNYTELNMVIFLNHIYLNKNKPTHSLPYCCPAQCNSSLTTWLMEKTQNTFLPHPEMSVHHWASHHCFQSEGGGRHLEAIFTLRVAGFDWPDVNGVCSWKRDITPARGLPWVGTGSWQAGTQHPQRGSIRPAQWLLTTSDGALTPHIQI